MTITVNGQPREVADDTTVAGLLRLLAHEPASATVLRNHAIVPRERFAATTLVAGDRVEVVTFVGGG